MERPKDARGMSGSVATTDGPPAVEQFRGTFTQLIAIKNNALTQMRQLTRSLNTHDRPGSGFEREHVPLGMQSVYARRHESPTS